MRGLIIVPMDLEPGFRKADIHSIPIISSGMVFNFFATATDNKMWVPYLHTRKHIYSYLFICVYIACCIGIAANG